jgi:hypothetical protein
MERFAVALAFVLCLLPPFLGISALAEDSKTAGNDSSAVRATVETYMEAYFSGDAQRMQQMLHPHDLKHRIHGNMPMSGQAGSEMVEEVRSEGSTDLPEAEQTDQITILDISADIASVKLVTLRSVAYMTLLKSGGEWKILSVVQRLDN